MGTNFEDLYNELDPALKEKIERRVKRMAKWMERRDQKIIDNIVHQLEHYHPDQVWLFGSFGTENFKPGISDIDLCIVMETNDRLSTLEELHKTIQCEHPIDFFLYNPNDWNSSSQGPNAFVQNIINTGILVFDGKVGASSNARSLAERNSKE